MQETASGSGISWAKCKSAPISSQITMPAPHHKDIIILIQISGTIVRVTSFMLFTQTLVEFHTVKTCPGVMQWSLTDYELVIVVFVKKHIYL